VEFSLFHDFTGQEVLKLFRNLLWRRERMLDMSLVISVAGENFVLVNTMQLYNYCVISLLYVLKQFLLLILNFCYVNISYYMGRIFYKINLDLFVSLDECKHVDQYVCVRARTHTHPCEWVSEWVRASEWVCMRTQICIWVNTSQTS
jgi:hypothetical protein